MTDFASLQLKIDSTQVEPAVNKLDDLTAAGARTEGSVKRLTASAGAQRAGMQQLSFQIGDVAQQFALGTRPMTIFAQQSGQVIQAIGLMRGSAGGLIGFLAGPWGAVLVGAATVVGALAVAHNDAADASGEQKKSAEDLVKAIDELYAATKKQTQSTYASVEASLADAIAKRTAATESRNAAVAELELAKARLQANLAQANRRDGAGDGGAAGAAGSGLLAANNERQIGNIEAEIKKYKGEIGKTAATTRLLQGQLVGMRLDENIDAMAAATGKFSRRQDELNNQLASGSITLDEYARQLNRAKLTQQAEEKAAQDAARTGRKKKEVMTDAERAYQRQVKETDRFIDGLELEIAKIGLDEKALRQLEIRRASDTAATQAQRESIAKLNIEREAAIALQEVEKAKRSNADYQRNVIGPIEREMQVLGLLGVERDKAISRLEEQAEVELIMVEVMAAETAGNMALAEELRKRIDLIRQAGAMDRQGMDAADQIEREVEATRRYNDQLRDMIYLLGRIGGLGGALGGLIGIVSGNTDAIGGPIGALLNMETGGKKVVDGKEVALTLGDELRDIFGEKFGQKMLDVLQGAGTGMIAGQAFLGNQGTAGQLGSAVGGALGEKLGEKFLTKGFESIAKGLGDFAGPLGSIVGGLVGGLLGGLMTKTKWGRVNLTAAGASDAVGNDSSSRRAAVKAGGGFSSALQDIADAFGGDIGDFGSIALGVRHGDWRVNTTGTSLKKKKGAVDFDGDAEAAISFALQEAIERGAITGIRESTQRLLKSSDDLQKNLEKALSFEGVFTELKSIKDPLGSALDNLTKEFDRLRKIFGEAGASAAEYAQLEELLAMKRAEAIADEGRRAIDKLSERNSLEVQLLELMGRSEDALAAARLNELASLEASLQPLQAMVYQLQDARAIIDQIGPLADDLKAFKQELLGGAGGTAGFATLQARFRETSALAKDGDAGALGNLRTTATEFLDAAKANASSALDYQRAVGEVLASVDQGIFAADSQVEYAQLQIDAVNNSANIIAGMREEMKVYQQQIVENTSYMARLWSRFEGDGLLIKTDTDTPLQVEVV
jgi:hypothetical protein